MSRAHLYRPVLDKNGNVLSDISVRIYESGGTSLIAETIYLDPFQTAPAQQPMVFADGIINFYLDNPKRVRIGVRQGVNQEVFFEDVDILASGGEIKAKDVLFISTPTLLVDNVQDAIEDLDITIDPLRHVPPGDHLLTKGEADTLYAPIPAPVAATDPETGDTTTFVPAFSLQTIVSGPLTVKNNIAPPGLRVIKASTAKFLIAHIGTPPTGAAAKIRFYRVNGGTETNLGTVTIAVGQGAGSLAVDVACAKGDLIRFEVTQIGSTVAGADINLAVDFA